MAALDVYDVIAMTIHANNGEMSNRTTIQKLLYFHTIKLQNFEAVPYKHHFYGPFNREVASGLEEMTAFSYLDEKMLPGYYESYHYTLTDSGKKYAEKTKAKFNDDFNLIFKTVKICKDYCDLKSTPLSYAAKAYYILTSTEEGRQGKYKAEDVREVGINFDWDISEEDILTGVELLEKLDLVTVS